MIKKLAIDPNRVPDVYESVLVGREDYSNPDSDGLSFSSGDTVYLLLQNQDGWLDIIYMTCYICILSKRFLIYYTYF